MADEEMNLSDFMAANAVGATVNGGLHVVPATASTGFIADNAKVPYNGANITYSPVVQAIYSLRGGLSNRRALVMAGFRLGVEETVNAANWVLHGNTFQRVKTAAATLGAEFPKCPRTMAAYTALPAHVQGLLDWDALTEANVRDLLNHMPGGRPAYPTMLREAYSVSEIVAGQGITLAWRRDEVIQLPDDWRVQVADRTWIQEPTTQAAIRHFAESGFSFALVVAYHLTRTDGHTFVTDLSRNTVSGVYRSALAATKVSGVAGYVDEDITSMMHDSFHPFANLQRIVHTVMALPGADDLYSRSLDYRYPFQASGAAAITSGAALCKAIKGDLRNRGYVMEKGWIVGPNNQVDMVNKAAKAIEEAQAAYEQDSSRFAVTGTGGGSARLASARKVVAFLGGVATGLGFRDSEGPRAAQSIKGAIRANDMEFRAGETVGRNLSLKRAREVKSLEQLGLDKEIQVLTA